MRRWEFIAGLAGTAAWPVVARALQPVPVSGAPNPPDDDYKVTTLTATCKRFAQA
jgi:hypothetical protein